MSNLQWAKDEIAYKAEYERYAAEVNALTARYERKMAELKKWKNHLDAESWRIHLARTEWMAEQQRLALIEVSA